MSPVAESLFELDGGEKDRLAGKFDDPFLADPLLRPLFRDPEEDHAGRIALFLIEVLGGPREYTRHHLPDQRPPPPSNQRRTKRCVGRAHVRDLRRTGMAFIPDRGLCALHPKRCAHRPMGWSGVTVGDRGGAFRRPDRSRLREKSLAWNGNEIRARGREKSSRAGAALLKLDEEFRAGPVGVVPIFLHGVEAVDLEKDPPEKRLLELKAQGVVAGADAACVHPTR